MINAKLKRGKEGFIIVISLVLVLVMMTMGIGLYYNAKQTSEQVGISIKKSDAFYTAESCIAEARVWLKKQSVSGAPCKSVSPGATCHSISNTKMSKWQISAENQTFKNRTNTQNYQCTISLLGKLSYEGGEGVGFDIGEGDTYGKGITKTKYMYRINAKGSIGNFESNIEVIDSMIF